MTVTADRIADDPTLTEAMSIPELIAVLPHTWDTHPRAQAAILERIWVAGTDADRAAALAAIHDSLRARETVWDGYDDATINRAMADAIARVIAHYDAIAG
jgi:hypothetical protein